MKTCISTSIQIKQFMKNILRIRNLAAAGLLFMAPLFGSAQSNGTSQQPAPYPTPNFTGNSEQDIRQHDQAVEQWKQQEKESRKQQYYPGVRVVRGKPGAQPEKGIVGGWCKCTKLFQIKFFLNGCSWYLPFRMADGRK